MKSLQRIEPSEGGIAFLLLSFELGYCYPEKGVALCVTWPGNQVTAQTTEVWRQWQQQGSNNGFCHEDLLQDGEYMTNQHYSWLGIFQPTDLIAKKCRLIETKTVN